MKFSYVTFVPNKQQQKKGKRTKPLSMVSYFTDTERFSTSNPFNGSLDLSLHFNVETKLHSSRRHVPPPVQIVIPSLPQSPLSPQPTQQPSKPTIKPSHSSEHSQPIPPRPIPVRSTAASKSQFVNKVPCEGLTSKTISYQPPHRKPRFAHPKDLYVKETMQISQLPSMSQRLTPSTFTTTTTTSTIPSPQKYDRSLMIAPVSAVKVDHCPTEMPPSGIQKMTVVSKTNKGQRQVDEETLQNFTLQTRHEQTLSNMMSCNCSSSSDETPVAIPVPRKVRTSISLFELLNPEDNESL
ncbi:hypothetical protein FDP41_004363 [Naegleria fowleri]|uniref:Uncharacterized protein n=1 Tax=Naegleria fowleri TaxID=5763 RepID=A0A6A5BQN5_NAEFO|nr:uncharacterized protein FDP41_004363 [Naegleria fowleri]KAF0976464.1 hypothetical protein FDP41_004363 [Naegleria fowleri]